MSTGRSIILCLALTISPLMVGSAYAATLRPTSEISGNRITLGDIFTDIDSSLGIDPATIVTNAPAPGQSLVLDARTLAGLARHYRIDWHPESNFDTATLRRASLRFGPDEISAALLATLPSSSLDHLGARTARLDNTQIVMHAPTGSTAAIQISNMAFDAASQRFTATASLADSGHTYAQASISGRITTVAQVPVLTRPLRRGDVIGAGDVAWQDMELGPGSAQILINAEDVIGRTPRQNLRAGLPLRDFDLTAPVVIARGSQVTMVFESGSLQITTQGRALSDGAVGETVRVVNLASSRTVEGRVEGSGVVRVGPAPTSTAANTTAMPVNAPRNITTN